MPLSCQEYQSSHGCYATVIVNWVKLNQPLLSTRLVRWMENVERCDKSASMTTWYLQYWTVWLLQWRLHYHYIELTTYWMKWVQSIPQPMLDRLWITKSLWTTTIAVDYIFSLLAVWGLPTLGHFTLCAYQQHKIITIDSVNCTIRNTNEFITN